MKFFNLDLHISVIEDIKCIFNNLGHQVDQLSISGHNWVFNRGIDNVDVINQFNWKSIDQNMCDDFYERYKNDLSGYDGFIVTHTPCFSLLYEKFDKPIFMVASTRYEQPFSNNSKGWDWLDEKLKSMIDRGQIIPISNNKYDKLYCERFLEREFTHIPSICGYTNSSYNPKKASVVSGRSRIQGYAHISDLGRFSWQDLYSHNCIIHIPYNVSVMSIFEQYNANVPLVFPTLDLARTLPMFLSEILFSPNCRVNESMSNLSDFTCDEVLYLSDFYDQEWMPNIVYFDSLQDLNSIVENDFSFTSSQMSKFNKYRYKRVSDLWSDFINSI